MNTNRTGTSEPTAPLGDTTSPAAIKRPLSQRVGGVEAPAAGRWLLHRTSSVMLTSARRPTGLHARDGWLDVATLPDMAALAIAADSGDTSVSLLAVACDMAADDAGTWTLVGRVTDRGTAHDITLDLTYHGVYRHGDTGYVRLTGNVATPLSVTCGDARRRSSWRSTSSSRHPRQRLRTTAPTRRSPPERDSSTGAARRPATVRGHRDQTGRAPHVSSPGAETSASVPVRRRPCRVGHQRQSFLRILWALRRMRL